MILHLVETWIIIRGKIMNLGAQFTLKRIIWRLWIYQTLIWNGHGDGGRVPLCFEGFAPTSGWADVFCAYCSLFACCVNVQIKHILMAESRYDKYVGHPGSFIILTARMVFWPAGTGQKYSRLLEWTWNVSAMIMGAHILCYFFSYHNVLKELETVSLEFYIQWSGWCGEGKYLGTSLISCMWFTIALDFISFP